MDAGVFTGLVETTGELVHRERRGPGFRLRVKTTIGPLSLGESISVSGACLTVTSTDPAGTFSADVSLETADKTTLGGLAVGSKVNLERSLAAGDRLGGHLVSGHVDGIATVNDIETIGDAWRVSVSAPPALMRFIAAKGSVALDGVSLTVNGVSRDRFDFVLIPHTRAVTHFASLKAGVALNLEVDVLARYVARYFEALFGETSDPPAQDARLGDLLARAGFTDAKRDL
jgi:riboflavin synthase